MNTGALLLAAVVAVFVVVIAVATIRTKARQRNIRKALGLPARMGTSTAEAQAKHAKTVVSMLDKEGVAYDIGSYRDAPAGFRVWGGATVETSDVQALTPWVRNSVINSASSPKAGPISTACCAW